VRFPFGSQQAGDYAVVSPKPVAYGSLVPETKLGKKLASPAVPLWRQGRDSAAPELIKRVCHYCAQSPRRQPIGPVSGKTYLNVAPLRLIVVKNHPRHKVLILVRHADCRTRAKVIHTGDAISNPLRHHRVEASDKPQI
jgi:hypothetical protein